MIIRSLITDETKIAFECVNRVVKKGTTLQIDDAHYNNGEIQGAIAKGWIEIVGPTPSTPATNFPMAEKRIRFQNVYLTKLAFEGLRDSVAPTKFIDIPLSKLEDREVRSAIQSGWLLDVENPQAIPERSNPVHLQELTSQDIVAGGAVPRQRFQQTRTAQTLPAGVPLTRPRPTGNAPIKAKPITSSGGGGRGDVFDGGVESGNDLYRESRVIDPGVRAPTPPKPKRTIEDILGEAKPIIPNVADIPADDPMTVPGGPSNFVPVEEGDTETERIMQDLRNAAGKTSKTQKPSPKTQVAEEPSQDGFNFANLFPPGE